MIEAILSNPGHPEYGVATIPFPIPREQYDHSYSKSVVVLFVLPKEVN